MIIECQTCHARFRLDESRIKGRGARVKCRKCGDSIIVLKDKAAPPPTAGGDDSFDLGSAVRDSAVESPGFPSPAGNLIPFPAPPRPEAPSAPESSPAPGEAPETGKDEVDLAFDRFLSAGREESSPSIAEKDATAPVEHAASADPGLRPDRELGALTLDLGPEEKLDLPPAVAMEPPLGEPPAEMPSPEFRGEGGFLISDSDTLGFLQEEHRVTAQEEPLPAVGDISLGISSTPVDNASTFLREPDVPMAPPVDRTPQALHEAGTTPAPGEDRSSPAVGELSFEGNATPAAVPVIEFPPLREEEPVLPPPVEPAAREGSPAQETPGTRSSAWPAVAAVLALLLAAGGYLGFTTSGRKTLEGAVPGIAAIWGGKPAGPPAPKYDLRNVIGYYDTGAASPRILVIKGQVANLSTAEKSGIRVQAALLDNNDAVLTQQAVYAGNVLTGEAIRKGDRDTLTKTLGNRFGEGLANMHVAPGKAIPFMVVFFDAPANIDSYRLEAKDGE